MCRSNSNNYCDKKKHHRIAEPEATEVFFVRRRWVAGLLLVRWNCDNIIYV